MEKLISQKGFSFSFNPSKCESCGGNCCTGESGYIWVNPGEAKSMAEYLGLELEDFRKDYMTKIGYKFSLTEKSYENGYACVFFDEDKKQCSIYEVRPSQCKSFPFWDYFKTNKKEAEKECPGIVF